MSRNSLGESRAEWAGAFLDAAEWFAATCGRAKERLGAPGLGEWTVRDLIGHTSRALVTVRTYMADPGTEPVTIPTAARYYAAAAQSDAAAVAERGREAGRDLGSDVVVAVRSHAQRSRDLIDSASDSAVATSPFGVVPLAEYLPTRTFELVVHTGDIERALGHESAAPARSCRSALRLATELALVRGLGDSVLAGVTGRGGLPADFTLL